MPEQPPRIFTYIVRMKTHTDCETEGYRVRASDVCTAITEAHRLAEPKHPGAHLRVVSIRELEE